MKRKQDEMVFALHRSGVPCWIFCPGNISGAYSGVSFGIAYALRSGVMGLVDGGRTPCNIVHVDNLVEAILTPIRTGRGSGERYFVNELEPVTWKQYFDDLLALLYVKCEYVPVARESILSLFAKQTDPGFVEQFRIALSGEFRKGLMILPFFQKLNDRAQETFSWLPGGMQKRVRARVERPFVVRKQPRSAAFSIEDVWVRAQIREPFHSPRKTIEQVGFQPVLSYDQGLETIIRWLDFVFSTDTHACSPQPVY